MTFLLGKMEEDVAGWIVSFYLSVLPDAKLGWNFRPDRS
jgi:hypothetical protein